jgi:signal transduction histidine kinase
VSEAALHFTRRVVIRQALTVAASFLVVGIFAPRLLVLEDDVAAGVLSAGVTIAALAVVTTAVMSLVALRRHRPLLRALAVGDADLGPADLGRFAELPSALTSRFFVTSSLIALVVLVPGVRPDKLDDGRAVSLIILAITIFGGAAIPHYVLTRQATVEVLELSPVDPLHALLDALEMSRTPWRRVTRRLLLAAVAPVALMGAGAVLVTHAHLRTLVEQSRRTTALLIARAALEAAPSPPEHATEADRREAEGRTRRGREAAALKAAELGFSVKMDTASADLREPVLSREPGGELVATAPLDGAVARISFSADLDPATITGSVAVGLLAVVLAGVLGSLFGRTLADDLAQATRSVRLLGTESVIRGGSTQIARPARYALVADLGRAIEELAQRFRVFAAAQERALDARAAAHRMRGLLFASVSHDLKSPLNAVLGFAELVGQGPLTDAQRESLDLIQRRGRELLGLIETILDAARVEAGQLDLAVRPAMVGRLVAEAMRKARELAGDVDAPLEIDIAEDVPAVPADPAYATRALAVIIAHGVRTAAADGSTRPTRVTAMRARDAERVNIDVDYGSREVTRDELEMLFARQATGRGRGLTLGLSLARSVIELHGGAVEVQEQSDGGVLCRVWFPLVAPAKRPQLSSFPTLG